MDCYGMNCGKRRPAAAERLCFFQSPFYLLLPILLFAVFFSAIPEAKGADDGLLEVNVSVLEVDGELRIEVLPADGSAPLMATERPLFTTRDCVVDFEVTPARGGFDLTVEIRNDGSRPARRPELDISGIHISDRGFTYLNTLGAGQTEELPGHHSRRAAYWSWGARYPDRSYSPLAAVFDGRFAVGLSVLYDPFEVRHGIVAGYHFGGADRDARMSLQVDLDDGGRAHTKGRGRTLLPPGAVDRYRVAVRFASPDRWLASLEPYRRFFREQYGPVRYQRDRRPVRAASTSSMGLAGGKDNPRGFRTVQGKRIDLHGWGLWVQEILDGAVAGGYRRIMVWHPGGLYHRFLSGNYPPEFMSDWPQKMVETAGELQKLRREGVIIGMWWGRASQVSGGWDSGELWVRDPNEPGDVEFAWNELRLAGERSVCEIGLDAWKFMPLWERKPFLLEMQDKFPELRFITEQGDCDIVHTLAPAYFYLRRQKSPAVLADWLNPGHETWIQMGGAEMEEWFEKISDWGMVPLTFGTFEHDASAFVDD